MASHYGLTTMYLTTVGRSRHLCPSIAHGGYSNKGLFIAHEVVTYVTTVASIDSSAISTEAGPSKHVRGRKNGTEEISVARSSLGQQLSIATVVIPQGNQTCDATCFLTAPATRGVENRPRKREEEVKPIITTA